MTQPTAQGGDNLFHVVLRGALLPAAAAGVVTAVVMGLTRGLDGLAAGLAGVVIALAFFASGLFVVGRFVRDTTQPMLFMAVGMAVYFAQVLVLLGVLVVARRIEGFDSFSAGVAMLVCVLVWQAAQVVAWRRARVPVYDDPHDDTPGGAAS
jgi:hypothetical protein